MKPMETEKKRHYGQDIRAKGKLEKYLYLMWKILVIKRIL